MTLESKELKQMSLADMDKLSATGSAQQVSAMLKENCSCDVNRVLLLATRAANLETVKLLSKHAEWTMLSEAVRGSLDDKNRRETIRYVKDLVWNTHFANHKERQSRLNCVVDAAIGGGCPGAISLAMIWGGQISKTIYEYCIHNARFDAIVFLVNLGFTPSSDNVEYAAMTRCLIPLQAWRFCGVLPNDKLSRAYATAKKGWPGMSVWAKEELAKIAQWCAQELEEMKRS